MKKNNLRIKFVSTNIDEKSSNSNIKENEKFNAFSKILNKFKRFKEKVRKILKEIKNLRYILNEHKI